MAEKKPQKKVAELPVEKERSLAHEAAMERIWNGDPGIIIGKTVNGKFIPNAAGKRIAKNLKKAD